MPVAQGLAHLLHPIEALQDGDGDDDLGLLTVFTLDVAPHEQVEELVRAPQLHVGLKGHGVVSLDQGVDQLVDGNGALALETLFEILPLEHPRHGVLGAKTDEVLGAELGHPLAVEDDLRLFRIEYLEDLFRVGLGVFQHLFAGEGRAGLRASRGVADHGGKVTDEEVDFVSQVLEMAHLAQEHGVPQM